MKAFPSLNKDMHPDYVKDKNAEGMDLRDYFAAHALGGFLSRGLSRGTELDTHGDSIGIQMASAAYAMADAMMEARK